MLLKSRMKWPWSQRAGRGSSLEHGLIRGGGSFLGRIRQEAAAKRDVPEAISIPGPLQGEMHAALDELLRRAQRAGAVRPEITTPDIITLLKGLLRSMNDAPPGRQTRPRRTGCSPSSPTDYGPTPDPAPGPQ
jgi:hypothetical protein